MPSTSSGNSPHLPMVSSTTLSFAKSMHFSMWIRASLMSMQEVLNTTPSIKCQLILETTWRRYRILLSYGVFFFFVFFFGQLLSHGVILSKFTTSYSERRKKWSWQSQVSVSGPNCGSIGNYARFQLDTDDSVWLKMLWAGTSASKKL